MKAARAYVCLFHSPDKKKVMPTSWHDKGKHSNENELLVLYWTHRLHMFCNPAMNSKMHSCYGPDKKSWESLACPTIHRRADIRQT